jgi:hypothetical protein
MAHVQGPAASLRVAGGKGVLHGEDGVLPQAWASGWVRGL